MKKKNILFLILLTTTFMQNALNILFLVKKFPYMNQMYILNQITGMLDRGHTVTILARERMHEKWPEVLEPYTFLKSSLYYGDLPKKKTHYDVILCQFAELDTWWFNLKQKGLKGKTVVFCRGWDVSTLLLENPARYKEFFAKTDLWLPVCEYFYKRLISYGYDGNKIVVLGSSIDCKKFKRSREKKQDDVIRCVTTARLMPKKGIEYAICAVAKLIKQYPNISYTVVGGGAENYENELRRLIGRFGIWNNVHLVGQKSHEEIISILHDTDIYIQPSVTSRSHNQEGIPNALKEAMAMELPVITTRHAGIPELVQNSVSGILVPEKSSADIKKMINFLIENPILCKELSKKARVAAQRYDIEVINDQLHNILMGLCQSQIK